MSKTTVINLKDAFDIIMIGMALAVQIKKVWEDKGTMPTTVELDSAKLKSATEILEEQRAQRGEH